MTPRRPAPLLLAFWLAAVVVATGVGVLAVRLVESQVGDATVPVLSTKDVASALTAAPKASTLPSRSATATPARPSARPVVAPKVFTSRGGSVGVRCRGSATELVYRTPAQGYVLDETSVEGGVLEVRFVSGRTRARLGISCGSGTPVLVENRVDTSGGGKG